MKSNQNYGGVSIFIVIFTALLVTVVTVGFTQLMIRNQQQTTNNDLSQRAYNSALAGVEDAKRVLLSLQSECNASSVACTTLRTIINQQNCDTIQATTATSSTTTSSGDEVTVGSSSDGQAYTCVKIVTSTSDYTDSLDADESVVVPLKATSAFSKVRVTWFTHSDSGQLSADNSVHTPDESGIPALGLATKDDWMSNYPTLMRAQYIPYGTLVSSLNTSAKTLFLYPEPVPGPATGDFDSDPRRVGGAKGPGPVAASCSSTYSGVDGACSIILSLPGPVAQGYLQLGALYNATHFTVELLDGSGAVVKFDNVEPIVDSTGRAGDLFRRIRARIKLGGVSMPLPNASVSSQDSICKDFAVKVGATAVYKASASGQSCEPDEGP